MEPKHHVVHTILFVLCAVLTFAYWGVSEKTIGGVELSNFKLLKLSDVASNDAIETHDMLLKKWKCTVPVPNSTAVALVEPWGPDSMCRCIHMNTCSGKGCSTVETDCSDKVVPSYAQVYAGYDSSHYNILLALFYLHIAVMLNMYIETREDELRKEREYSVDDNQIDAPNQKEFSTSTDDFKDYLANTAPPQRDPPNQPQGQSERSSRRQREQSKRGYYEVEPSVTNYQEFDGRKKTRVRSNLGYIYLGGNGLKSNGQNNGEATEVNGNKAVVVRTWGQFWLSIVKNKTGRLLILFILSGVCTGISWNLLFGVKIDFRQPGQTCSGETCMTETLISVVTITISTVDAIMFLVFAMEKYIRHNFTFEFSISAMSAWEGVHNTVAFMLLVSSFSTMSGVHDDTTLLFDILMVVFIGFLQSIQHIIMLQREEVIAYCRHEGIKVGDVFDKEHTVEETILSYYLYTRLFLFLVIILAVFVFMERLQPSISSSGFSENWNSYMRNAVLLLSLAPSVIADVGYEVSHIVNMRTTGVYSPYIGAHVWRRAVFLSAMILYIVISLKVYQRDTTALGL
jgi:hypothetical protein